MPNIQRTLSLVLLLVLSASCGAADGPAEPSLASGMHLALATRTPEGAEFRLTRGTFTIVQTDSVTPAVKVVTVDPAQDARTLTVPLEPGSYEVRLEPGWELSVSYGGPFLPVAATLSSDSQVVTLYQNSAEIVTFDFELGQTGLTLGISVWGDTYAPPLLVPDGYDGVLVEQRTADYAVYLAGLGTQCCWPTPAAARSAFPDYRLYDPAE